MIRHHLSMTDLSRCLPLHTLRKSKKDTCQTNLYLLKFFKILSERKVQLGCPKARFIRIFIWLRWRLKYSNHPIECAHQRDRWLHQLEPVLQARYQVLSSIMVLIQKLIELSQGNCMLIQLSMLLIQVLENLQAKSSQVRWIYSILKDRK